MSSAEAPVDAATRERVAAMPPLNDDQAAAVAAALDHIAVRARQAKMAEASTRAAATQ